MARIKLKFRQWNNGSWHYWGQIEEGSFVQPINLGEKSYQYIGKEDAKGKEIYEGDRVKYRVSPVRSEEAVIKRIENGFWISANGVMKMPVSKDIEVFGNTKEDPIVEEE